MSTKSAYRATTIVPLVVACAYFMENFDGTVIATALPSMARSFGTTAPAASVGITAYLLAVAVFIPMSGWLADRYGSRTVFRAAIAVFTLASLLCGVADSLPTFTAARLLQGVGGAMMVPIGRLVVLRAVSRAEYVRAMSLVTMPGVIGQVLGPPIGGFFTTYLNWRWIFFVNIPIGLLGMVLVTLLLDNVRSETPQPFDWWGAGLVGGAIACLVFSLGRISAEPGLGLAALLLAIGAALGALSIRYLRRRAHAILDLHLFKTPTFAMGALGQFLFRMAAAGIGFVLPLLLQIGFGMPAATAGMLVFFSAAGAFVMKGSAPPILRRYGFRSVLIFNGVLSAVSIAACVLFSASTPVFAISLVLLAGGFARSLQFAALNAVVYADMTPAQMSAATSFASMLQSLAAATGVAASAVMLRTLSGAHGSGAALPLSDMRMTLIALAAVILISSLPFTRIARAAGDELSGRVMSPRTAAKPD